MAKRFLSPINFVNLSSDPASGTDGDIYYNSVSNKFKYYNGSSWVDLASGGATLSETAPSSPSEGDTWFKESTNSFYIYDGTYWVEIATTVDAGGGGGGVTVSDTAPSTPSEGDLWYKSDTGRTYVYYDSYWVEIGTGAYSPTGNYDGGLPDTTYGGVTALDAGYVS